MRSRSFPLTGTFRARPFVPTRISDLHRASSAAIGCHYVIYIVISNLAPLLIRGVHLYQ